MQPFIPSSLVQSFETNIFSELASYKKELINKGEQLIDLSIGSPDLPPPNFIIETLVKATQDGTQYGYALKGTDAFHEAVASFYNSNYHVSLSPSEEIVQLMGSQDGLVHLPMVMAEPGDLILVPDPGYPAYEAGVKMSRAKIYPMPLKKGNNFLPDLTDIPSDIAEKAKLMILNFPGNPVPALATKEFFEEVVQFAKKYNIYVIHDFAYSELVFDGNKAVSFLEASGATEVGVEFHSLSKSFNMAGCRIGFVVGNKFIIEQLEKLKSNLDYGVFLPIQKAGTEALLYGSNFLNQNRLLYEERRNVLIDGLHEMGWKVEKPKASMFIWAEIPKGYSSKEFVFTLMRDAGVVVTPGDAFGAHGEGYVRIALVQNVETIRSALTKLKNSGIFS